MKRLSLLSLALFLSLTQVFAQAKQDVEASFLKFNQALLDENVEALQSLTSKDLSYGHSSGGIEDQEAFLDVFRNKSNDYQRWDVSEVSIQTPSPNLAILRHMVDGVISANGQDIPLSLGVMMIWVKEKGNWKLLARQAYKR
ncbi:nuclear transport factor 2 family protein [Algoriphagus sp. CAU 1675]|uniref:nuclear transport factor 2 family protein n=1 Tax=Algoriphagus sp. CAU 1675 TaxID=3032597 RepID=UPI0023DC10CF|nr:nuclear transport factor 2 family protein [Algoriphagus sp. CAU 1675]MDF2157102.1 nuclear transport factor 2 family protein [Algoriphagus sp. CAU 1675]